LQSGRVPGTAIYRAAGVWDGVAASPLVDGFILVDDWGRSASVREATIRWTNEGKIAVTQILGQKAFAVLLGNFTDSANPKPFSLAQAQTAWDTIRRFWEYDSYGKVGL
jgi:hypothetical protein